ncbi:MAG: hypothetical protein ABEJ31_14240 [Haloarculaceae archaeon]
MAMDAGDADASADRGAVSRFKLWVLLDANRWVLTAVVLGAILATLLALGYVDALSFRAAVSGSDPIETLFQAFVTAIITGVTLVVTINQLVLFQKLGPLDDQRDRMEGALEFRRDTETKLDVGPSPPEPAAFLHLFLSELRSSAETLAAETEECAADGADDPLENLRSFAETLRVDTTRVIVELEAAEFGTFEFLSATLDFNYSWKLYETRALRYEHGGRLSDESAAALSDIQTALELFGPAREHFKTLYFRWELINLSRVILYASVPALVVSIAMIQYADVAAGMGGETFGLANVLWVVSTAAVLGLLPFVVLLVYVLRIGTVTKRTLANGPFVLRADRRQAETD